jgi:anaerobic dimethyl sulfoxide reductase subunit A
MKIKLKELLAPKLSRRNFVKTGSVLGSLAAVASSVTLPFK